MERISKEGEWWGFGVENQRHDEYRGTDRAKKRTRVRARH